MQFRISLIAISLLVVNPSWSAELQPMPVVNAKEYHQNINLQHYWQSEKLDGIRAVWDGQQLKTRSGYPIQAPEWFTTILPDYPVEGELWAGREQFFVVQQTVLDHIPSDHAWRKIKFMLFDLPGFAGDYRTRYQHLIELTSALSVDHIHYIPHTPVLSEEALLAELDSLFLAGGEGIMLRKVSSHYTPGRSDDLLKLKKHQDAEARVIGYKMGKGKYHNRVGSLLVRTEEGVEFAVGSGLSDPLRQDPPEIGSIITYQFNGLTASGKPRFARFLRIKQ